MNPKTRNGLLIGAVVLGALCLCIVLAGIGGALFLRAYPASVTVSTPVVIVEEITVVVGPTQAPAPSATPQPTETTQPTAALPTVDFESVHFSYDPAIASQITGEVVEARTGADLPNWEILPRHLRFELDGYLREGQSIHPAEILVFPLEDYAQTSEGAAPEIEKLQQALAGRTAKFENEYAPFLPGWNAAQMFHAQLRYLDHGLRYITQYGQDVSPISNDRLFYTYQGLAGDGKFYVSAIFPVRSPILPETGALDDYQAFADQFMFYINDTRDQLDGEPPENFTPDLKLLDALVESIVVKTP